jgi:hypothetical protein
LLCHRCRRRPMRHGLSLPSITPRRGGGEGGEVGGGVWGWGGGVGRGWWGEWWGGEVVVGGGDTIRWHFKDSLNLAILKEERGRPRKHVSLVSPQRWGNYVDCAQCLQDTVSQSS